MKKQYRIQNKLGLHVRPAKHIVEAAKLFPECTIKLEKDGKLFDAKSLVSVLSAGAKFGESIALIVEGSRAEEAHQAIGAILEAPVESPSKKG